MRQEKIPYHNDKCEPGFRIHYSFKIFLKKRSVKKLEQNSLFSAINMLPAG